MGHTNCIRVVTFATLVAWLAEHKSPIAEDRQTNRPSQHSNDIVINDIMQTYRTYISHEVENETKYVNLQCLRSIIWVILLEIPT